ncbi:MAG: AMP-binding protein [Lentisphaeria bacterium]|nr:AMP-binding protein [Lentisphaeria bacterium]
MKKLADSSKNRFNVFRISLFSTFNPVYFCTLTALFFFHDAPIIDTQAYNVLLVAFLYTLPWLCSSALSKYLLTKYSSRGVIVHSKLAELGVAFLAMLLSTVTGQTGYIPLFAVAVMLGLSYSIYRPALKTYAAVMLSRQQTAGFAAAVECGNFLAIVLGTVTAAAMFYHDVPVYYAVMLLFPMALLGLTSSFSLSPVYAPAVTGKYQEPFPLSPPAGLKKQQRYRELIFTGFGECYIFASIVLIPAMAIEFCSEYFNSGTALVPQYVFMGIPLIGAAAGVISSGKRSKGNIEIGLVPAGVLLMGATILGMAFLPQLNDLQFNKSILAVLLLLFGFAAGSILVPLQSYQTYFIKKELAPAFFSWYYLLFSTGILLAEAAIFLIYFFNISIFAVMLTIFLLTMVTAATIFALMPQFLLRMLIRVLLAFFYRLKIFHGERLPETGPALLISNRASFVDMLFISACTSRPIRFMMHEHYFRTPILHSLYKSVGFLEVPSKRPKQLKQLIENTRQLLKNGELICVFPEDDITRNGTMSTFRNGVGNLVPPDDDIPVIPMRIGMTWGSIFSCSNAGKFKLQLPTLRRHPASVTIGNPIKPDTSAYEMRIIISELAAETELVPDRDDYPLHTRFVRFVKRNISGSIIMQCESGKWIRPNNFMLMLRTALFSRYLRKNVVANDEEYVGIMLPNSIDMAMCMLAIQMCDRTPAVLNYTASAEAIKVSIAKANLRHIFTSRKFVEKLNIPVIPQMIFLEDIRKTASWISFARYFIAMLLLPANEIMRQLSPGSWNDVEKVGTVIFSSGSTGIPKGVMLTHHNIISDVLSISNSLSWKKSDSVVGNLPLFHSFGMAVCFWMPIVTGTKTVLIPNALDAASVAEAMRKEQLTVLCATPGFLQIYMRRCVPEDFHSLRIVITGAEKLRQDVAEKFRNMTGIVITEGYGCTELSPVVSINLSDSVSKLGSHVVVPGSIGPPLIGICAKVVDPSTFELMPEDTDGLLIVTGAVVMKGYLGEPEKTKEVIRDNWYITGDMARMSRNGFITLTGRLSRFSKIAGEMVPHELVEREINNIVKPDDRIIAVCGTSDPVKGEKLIVFYSDRELIAPESIIKSLRANEIPNLWIPKQENFIYTDKIPVLGSGKLDLAALQRKTDELK